jgi:glycosyltransferase involved in cell wall biosynthesis
MISILIPCRNEPKIHDLIKEIERLFPQDSQIIVCNDREGKGKGWAVRQALKAAEGDIICFIDGDFDIHPKMINRLIPFLDNYDVIVGRKEIRGRIARKTVTFLSRIFIRLLFNLNIDTQTGIKVFTREAIPDWENDGFLFDVEILIKAKNAGFKIVEVPVEVTPYGATSKTIRSKNVFKCFLEALKIWRDNI